MDNSSLTFQGILEAAQRIKAYIRHTPLAPQEKLTDKLPAHLWLKLENMQVSGSFKARGVFNNILKLSPEQRSAGIVVPSGGNHGLAAAYAGWKLGVPVTVCLPETATEDRRARLKPWGARAMYAGSNPSHVMTFAQDIAAREGLTLIHPFDAVGTMEGTGTLGLEIIQDVPDIDCAIIAIGGGGLIAGAAFALKQKKPKIKVIGVEPVGAASMLKSLEAGTLTALDSTNTIADTLSPAVVSERTLESAKKYVDEMVLVSDGEMLQAMELLWTEYNQLVEPAGAAAIAAVLFGHCQVSAFRAPLAIVCGGNAAAGPAFRSYVPG